MNTLKLYGMQGQLKAVKVFQGGYVLSTLSPYLTAGQAVSRASGQGFWSRKFAQGRKNYKLWLHAQLLQRLIEADAKLHEFERLSSLEVSDL